MLLYMDTLISPLCHIVKSYLVKSSKFDQRELIKYDPELMIYYLNKGYCEGCNMFHINALYGHLDNMKWLSDHNFPYDKFTFMCASYNGDLDNMKWLLENNFPYDAYTFRNAALNGNLDN